MTLDVMPLHAPLLPCGADGGALCAAPAAAPLRAPARARAAKAPKLERLEDGAGTDAAAVSRGAPHRCSPPSVFLGPAPDSPPSLQLAPEEVRACLSSTRACGARGRRARAARRPLPICAFASLLTRACVPSVRFSLIVARRAQLCAPPAAPLRLAALPGRLLLIGFGSIGAGVLPLLLRHVSVPAERVTLLTAPDRGAEATAAAAAHGLACVIATLTPDNYRQVRAPRGRHAGARRGARVGAQPLARVCTIPAACRAQPSLVPGAADIRALTAPRGARAAAAHAAAGAVRRGAEPVRGRLLRRAGGAVR
jgi:hypothetical protein